MSPAALCVAASRRRLLVDAKYYAWAAFVPSFAVTWPNSARFALLGQNSVGWMGRYRLALAGVIESPAVIESLGHLVVYGTPSAAYIRLGGL